MNRGIESVIRLGIATAFLAIAWLQAPSQETWANLERYAEANKQLAEPGPNEKRVVFIGNSVTDLWIGYHPEFFSTNNYVDRGISGQVTSQILLRFREDVLNLKPALVVIAGGTNDAAEVAGPYKPEITLGNFKTMVELARAHGIKVVIGSLLPCEKFTWGTTPSDAPATIEHLNRLLRDYAQKEGIPFADYYTPMVQGKEKALNPDWTWDHIHPNLEGYKVMESVIKPLIDKELSK